MVDKAITRVDHPNMRRRIDAGAGARIGLITVPPLEAGFQTITQTVTLTDTHGFTSEGTTEFFRLDGTSYRSVCASASRRFP
jgi:hypothetical protein